MSIEKNLLLAAIVLFSVLAVLMILPYEQYVLLAVLLGYLLYPLQRRLQGHIGTRISAGLLIVGTVLLVVIPIGLFLGIAVQQATSILNTISRGEFGVGAVESILREQTGISIDINRLLTQPGSDTSAVVGLLERSNVMGILGTVTQAFGDLIGVVGTLSEIVIGITVFLFVLYYLLVDGPALVSWLRMVSPFRESTLDRLHERVDQLMWAVLFGNLLVAIVQGVLLGIGFAALGVTNAIFWSIITIILSLFPLIGASVVWIPAVGYLFIAGQPVTGIILFVYGALVVSLSDNYLRPMVGGREARLNPGLFVVGIFGGLTVFGVMGIFFGPIVLGLLKVCIELFADRQSPVHPAM